MPRSDRLVDESMTTRFQLLAAACCKLLNVVNCWLRVGGGRCIAPIGNNRRALRDINRNIIDVPPLACAVNKISFLR
ncbi:hypothetical protein Droror1_Dr00011884 [Drosera rotundifolia]